MIQLLIFYFRQYPFLIDGAPIIPAKVERLEEALKFVDDIVKNGSYIAGTEHLTLADFAMAAGLSTIAVVHDVSKFAGIVAYLQKCKRVMKGWEELNEKGVAVFRAWYESALEKAKKM